MAVITRPAAPLRPVLVDDDAPAEMQMAIANALITDGPLSDAALRLAMEFYRDLAERLSVAGPGFSSTRQSAVGLHNRCVQRLRETAAERERRIAQAKLIADGLVEIER